jgi:beta-phosphoglucomutase-like phosphatase (HAD superfamily)
MSFARKLYETARAAGKLKEASRNASSTKFVEGVKKLCEDESSKGHMSRTFFACVSDDSESRALGVEANAYLADYFNNRIVKQSLKDLGFTVHVSRPLTIVWW